MDSLFRTIIVGFTVFCTYAVEGISGFGSSVLALPFITLTVGLQNAVPLLSFLGWLIALYIVMRSRKNINFREFFFMIVHVIPGIPVGLLLAQYLPRTILLSILAAVMISVGIHGILKTLLQKKEQDDSPVKKSIWMRLILFIGGVIHGSFSCGGPFIVIYASKALKDKSLFRVTLSMIWVVSNSVMLCKWTVSGNVWNPLLGRALLMALPFMLAGMVLGDLLHNKVNQRTFRLFVYAVLPLAGLTLVLNMLCS